MMHSAINLLMIASSGAPTGPGHTVPTEGAGATFSEGASPESHHDSDLMSGLCFFRRLRRYPPDQQSHRHHRCRHRQPVSPTLHLAGKPPALAHERQHLPQAAPLTRHRCPWLFGTALHACGRTWLHPKIMASSNSSAATMCFQPDLYNDCFATPEASVDMNV